jgi:hypothetical protein
MKRPRIKHLPTSLRRARLNQRDFLRWLYAQPAGRRFDMNSARDCPVATYLRESGHPRALVAWNFVSLAGPMAAPDMVTGTWVERFQRLAMRRKRVTTVSCIVDLFRATRRRALSMY